MKIKRVLFIGVASALVAVSAFAYFDRQRVTVSSNDNKREYRRIDHVGSVRLVKQLSDKPCTFNRTWGYDSNGIWVDRGCRAEFEYETRDGGSNRPGIILPGGGWDTKRVTVESNDGRRVYRRMDTSGGVKLVKRLSDKPCTIGRSWGYDANGIWVDDGCRAEFEVRTRGNGNGNGNNRPWIGGRVPSWAVGTWRGTRGSARGYEMTLQSGGAAWLRKDNELGEGRRGDISSDRVRFGDAEYQIEQDGRDKIKLTPISGGARGAWYFERR